MSDRSIESPRRRGFLAGVGAGLVAYSTVFGTTAAESHESVRVVLDNVGASAWELVEADEEVGAQGVENPDLSLREGTRYTFENRGGDSHPLAFRDEDGNDLLSQSSAGSYEDQDDVNYVEDGDEMTFTVTEQFAEDVGTYICTFHASMEGQVTTGDSDEPAAAVEMSDQETDGTSVTVDFTRVDDGGFMTIHDSSLLDGEVIPSVRGVSSYLGPGEYEDLEIELDDALTESDTLIAMPHRDTNDNEEYDFVETDGDADGPYADENGEAIVDDAAVTVVEEPSTLTLPNQATASSTFTRDDPTRPGVAVQAVTAPSDSAVVVTYEDGDDLVIAGLDTFSAEELDESDVVIPVEDDGGFPGEHVAHLLPADELSGEYTPGDVVLPDTAEAVADNDAAMVVQATLSFDDQRTDGTVETGDVLATVDVAVSGGSNDGEDGDNGNDNTTQYSTVESHHEETRYVVDVHPTDDDGGLVGPEFVGATDVLTGDNPSAEIIAERVPDDGEFNELPFVGTDTCVAMIHVVDDGSAVGDAASPGSFPVLPNVDGEDGPVPGGVTDLASVTTEPDEPDEDDAQDGEPDEDDESDDPGDDEPPETDDTTDDPDDDGPGFGPVAGAAGLGGIAAYAYRKLRLDSEPPTPEDDGLEE